MYIIEDILPLFCFSTPTGPLSGALLIQDPYHLGFCSLKVPISYRGQVVRVMKWQGHKNHTQKLQGMVDRTREDLFYSAA